MGKAKQRKALNRTHKEISSKLVQDGINLLENIIAQIPDNEQQGVVFRMVDSRQGEKIEFIPLDRISVTFPKVLTDRIHKEINENPSKRVFCNVFPLDNKSLSAKVWSMSNTEMQNLHQFVVNDLSKV